MDAKNLMIGDWYYDQNLNEPRKWHQLQFAEEFGNSTYMLLVKPIALTDDILKVNGFEKSKDVVFMILKHTSKVRLIRYIEKWDEDEPVEYRGHWAFEENFIIDYVHQLQHALRLCGLTELADNFKLKKD